MRTPINNITSAPSVTEPTADVAGGSHQRMVGAQPCICAGCDWWEDRTMPNGVSLTGWCDLFKKYTHPTHGTKCTGHTPIVRSNAGAQRPPN